ncbi:hypothetical protein DICVIV_13235 [Dictyocaulus viviparus]|uniref:CHK kinase-like domain-containing protein n=1 Tax=Dictyocaulus viviparus TaxID=29172 RepID=A0A0D8X8D6_DICVI|nr:hypothetical protein DICVIV_13235 [Dictyocaulus viviparus]
MIEFECDNKLKSWIESVLEREHHQKPIIVKAEPLEHSMGHMSNIIRFYLDWPNHTKTTSNTVIAKIPTSKKMRETLGENNDNLTIDDSDDVEEEDDFLEMIHNIESESYRFFKKVSCEGLYVPYFYDSLPFSASTPCLLMEDIHSCHVIDIVDGFDDNQLYQIVDQLVALHVYCLTQNNWKTLGMDSKVNRSSKNYVALIDQMTKRLKADHPVLEKGLDLLHRNYTSNDVIDCIYAVHDIVSVFEDVVRTYVHGDLWSANILWKGDKLAAIVDWTLCHSGSLKPSTTAAFKQQ